MPPKAPLPSSPSPSSTHPRRSSWSAWSEALRSQTPFLETIFPENRLCSRISNPDASIPASQASEAPTLASFTREAPTPASFTPVTPAPESITPTSRARRMLWEEHTPTRSLSSWPTTPQASSLETTSPREPSEKASLSGEPPNEASLSGEPPNEASLSGEPPNEASLSGEPPNEAPPPGEPPNEATPPREPPNEASLSGEPPNEASLSGEPPNEASFSGEPPNEASLSGEPPNEAPLPREPPNEASLSGEPPNEASLSGEPPNEAPPPREPPNEAAPSPEDSQSNFPRPNHPFPSERQNERLSSHSTPTPSLQTVNLFVREFKYEAKRHSTLDCIKKYPFNTCVKFKPRYAAYSHRKKVVYILSGNNLLKYDLRCRNDPGHRLRQLDNLMDIALSESGGVICINHHCAMRLEENDRGHVRRPTKFLRFNKAVQICCHGKEVVILDVGHKYLAQFFEDGTFIRNFGADRLKNVDEKSKICMDQEGRTYVYSGVVVERKDAGRHLCSDCDKFTGVHIYWRIVIYVFNINGDFVDTVNIKEEKDFSFRLTCPLVCRRHCSESHRYPITSSVPSNDQIARKYAVGGMCIDADAFLTLTQPMLGRISVYDLNSIDSGPFHVIAARGKKKTSVDFKEPHGVCLTESEMIVCDPGRGRVQIL